MSSRSDDCSVPDENDIGSESGNTVESLYSPSEEERIIQAVSKQYTVNDPAALQDLVGIVVDKLSEEGRKVYQSTKARGKRPKVPEPPLMIGGPRHKPAIKPDSPVVVTAPDVSSNGVGSDIEEEACGVWDCILCCPFGNTSSSFPGSTGIALIWKKKVA
ncbi:hypothetical protein QFC20_007104 [Naganishia adeliensis]|uniref:Uncharacterized protein n=1 Tax=Naganishia adeliensis TaxID=92952 RepID=A0ACC2V3A5_9TREE|nr:hypothetical protein QFC20_007104 [Naganishia adeliensis]